MATVSVPMGTVENTGKGFFTVSEEITRRDGGKFKQFYKVWVEARVNKGDIVSVSGTLSAKPAVDFNTGQERKWTDSKGVSHTSVEISINDAEVVPFASRANAPF